MANQKYYADIDLNQNELQNAVIQNLASAPATPTAGQVYFNTVDKVLYTYDGTNWVTGESYSEGSGIDITSNVISIDNSVTAATKCKITYSAQGLVTGGADLSASDIPSLSLSKISDVTATAAEVNVLDGITASTAELNILDGVTATTTEINYIDGVTSAIQTQLNGKLAVKPDGTNNLIDSSDKINLTYVPDVLLGQMLYAGTFVPSTAVATLSTNAQTILGTTSSTITLTNDTTAITGYVANEGNYYICSADGTFASISFLTGDWLISTGSGWSKVSNTDAVTGVKGNAEGSYRTGNVNITADNVLPTQTSNSGKFLTTNGTTCSWGDVPSTLPSQTGNSGKFLTTNGTNASWATIAKTFTANNTALTASGGVCTWEVTNSASSTAVLVQVVEISTNKVIGCEIAITSSKITMKFNSVSNIAANTFRMVAIG